MYLYKFRMELQRRIQNFPDGGANPKEGVTTYYSTKFPQNLHENKENLAEEGGASKICLCRPAIDLQYFNGENLTCFFTY